MLAVLRYAFAVAVLAYASYCDLRTREVSDLVWLLGCPVGLALSLLGIFAAEFTAIALIISLILSICIGVLLFYFGLIGGADALAFLFIGLTLPAYQDGFPLLGDPLAFPIFAIFCNAAILSLTCPLAVFALNVADALMGQNPFRGVEVNGVGELVALMFTTKRISFERLTSDLYYFPAERPVERGGRLVREPIYFVRAEADISAITEEMVKHRELYSGGVLASPTLPMIVFLTLGLTLLPLGNIVFLIFRHLTGWAF